MSSKKSDSLSRGDVISFIALLLIGVIVFLGINFKTLGDKIISVIGALLLLIVMSVAVFLAAHAKAQNRNQSKWRNVEHIMLGLYVLMLIPFYIYAAKFFDIYLDKTSITQQVREEVDGLNKMFSDYNRLCESRCNSYQTTLEAMSKDAQGRAKIASLLDLSEDKVSQENIQLAVSSFSNTLKGGDYKLLETEMKKLEKNVESSIKGWNVLFLPQYVSELGGAKSMYARELEIIYDKHKNSIERNIPKFDSEKYISESNIVSIFSRGVGFSFMGILAVIVLGGLGLVKYILGDKRSVVELKEDNPTAITGGGGIII